MRILLFFLALAVTTITTSVSVSAASAYDNLVQPVQFLTVADTLGNSKTYWNIDDLAAVCGIEAVQWYDAAASPLQTFAIYQVTSAISSEKVVEVRSTTTSDNGTFQWYTTGGGVQAIRYRNAVVLSQDAFRIYMPDASDPICVNYGGTEAAFGDFAVYNTNTDVHTAFPYWIAPRDGVSLGYPPGYEGKPLPTEIPPQLEEESLLPDFNLSVDTDGVLKVSYMKNIQPFLTGAFGWSLDKMNDDWEGIQLHLDDGLQSPAGWFEYQFDLTSTGYYMIRLDHNQQLDSPPWPANSTGRIAIEQRYVQFYWDGTAINIDTVGCASGTICNKFLDDTPVSNSWWNSFGFSSGGLEAMVLAPLDAISKITTSSNCQPVSLPLFGSNLVLPCLLPFYQAHYNSFLVIWQLVSTALIGYWGAISVFGAAKATISTDDQSIEVVKL